MGGDDNLYASMLALANGPPPSWGIPLLELQSSPDHTRQPHRVASALSARSTARAAWAGGATEASDADNDADDASDCWFRKEPRGSLRFVVHDELGGDELARSLVPPPSAIVFDDCMPMPAGMDTAVAHQDQTPAREREHSPAGQRAALPFEMPAFDLFRPESPSVQHHYASCRLPAPDLPSNRRSPDLTFELSPMPSIDFALPIDPPCQGAQPVKAETSVSAEVRTTAYPAPVPVCALPFEMLPLEIFPLLQSDAQEQRAGSADDAVEEPAGKGKDGSETEGGAQTESGKHEESSDNETPRRGRASPPAPPAVPVPAPARLQALRSTPGPEESRPAISAAPVQVYVHAAARAAPPREEARGAVQRGAATAERLGTDSALREGGRGGGEGGGGEGEGGRFVQRQGCGTDSALGGESVLKIDMLAEELAAMRSALAVREQELAAVRKEMASKDAALERVLAWLEEEAGAEEDAVRAPGGYVREGGAVGDGGTSVDGRMSGGGGGMGEDAGGGCGVGRGLGVEMAGRLRAERDDGMQKEVWNSGLTDVCGKFRQGMVSMLVGASVAVGVAGVAGVVGWARRLRA